MPKGATKYIVGGSMVLLGIILMVIAVCIGGTNVFNIFRGGLYINSSGIHIGGYDDLTNTEDSIVDINSIKNLKVDFDYGEMIIRSGNVDEVKIETRNIVQDRLKCGVNGDTLEIKYDRSWNIVFFSFTSSDARIEITVPETISFEKAEIRNGAGRMTVADINVDELIIENGAGEMVMNNVTATDELNIDGGVGAITVTDTVCGSIDADLGIGEFRFTGEINGNGKMDSGVGAVYMTLYGDRNDYDFRVDSGIGQVTTPGSNSGAKYIFDVSSGIGEVKITMEPKEG